jgi:hypothetical protein
MNSGVPGTNCAAVRVPCKIWYSRTFVITSSSLFLNAVLNCVYGILLKASSLGARICVDDLDQHQLIEKKVTESRN